MKKVGSKKGSLKKKNKSKFWPFDKISYDVKCSHMNITHGIYDDDEPHVTTSCKCGFDLFYMEKSKLTNQLNYYRS
jgi:transcription elongation factor Elf1